MERRDFLKAMGIMPIAGVATFPNLELFDGKVKLEGGKVPKDSMTITLTFTNDKGKQKTFGRVATFNTVKKEIREKSIRHVMSSWGKALDIESEKDSSIMGEIKRHGIL